VGVVDLESHGDHVIVEAVVPEPDGHCMQRRQLPDSRRSIHASEAKYGQVTGHQCAVLRFGGGAYLGPVATRTALRSRGANAEN